MVDSRGDGRAGPERIDLLCLEFEAQEMHRRGFLVIGPFEIFVGDCEYTIEALYLHVDAVLDADELLQHRAALLCPGKLDHKCRFPVRAVGYQRVIGVEFVVDSGRLEDALDAQHLLHLVLHRHPVLEVQRRIGP